MLPLVPAARITRSLVLRSRPDVAQHPIDAGATNAETTGNVGSAQPFSCERPHLGSVNRRLAALVNPFRLRLRDPLHLAFLADRGFELGKHPKHLEEASAGGRCGVDWL